MRIAVLATWLGAAGVLAALSSPTPASTPLLRLERRVVVAPAETLAVVAPAELRAAGNRVVLLHEEVPGVVAAVIGGIGKGGPP